MTQRRPRRLRPYRNGTRVLIVQDCRDGSPATGLEGTIESKLTFHGDGIQRRSRCTLAIPRIRLDDGSKIDGCWCWWAPLTDIVGTTVATALSWKDCKPPTIYDVIEPMLLDLEARVLGTLFAGAVFYSEPLE